jgi:hypothetical protein
MSYFQRSHDTVSEPDAEPETRPEGSRLSDWGDRISKAFATHDRRRPDQPALQDGETSEYDVLGDGPPESELPQPYQPAELYEPAERYEPTRRDEPAEAPRFPVGALGYNRGAVDEYIADMERELVELRARARPGGVSITEEIERLGEQTASILVVAHDQANETTRRAQEQADHCIADAAANAVAMTEQAKGQLRELDLETDAVWRERRRLVEDVRTTATALFALAEDAIERFPEDEKPVEDMVATE